MITASRGADRLWLRLALLVFAVGVFAYRDNIMDDTWIHLQYARNLRAHGELAFNSGEPSLALTSPLWVLLLAALGGSEVAARLASVGAGALAVWAFAVLARRTLGSAAYATAASVAWGANVWLVRHAPNGMESTLAVLFVVLAVDLHLRPGHSRLLGMTLGVVLAAAFLTRPEAALLIAVLACSDLRSAVGRRRALVWAPVCVLLCGAWLVFAAARSGHVFASTAGAKSGEALAALAATRVLWREARIVGAVHVVELTGMLVALVLFVRLEGVAAAVRAILGARLAAYAAFGLVLVFAFAALDVQVQPRYLLPLFPAIVLIGFAAWRSVLGGRTPAAWILALLCVAVNALLSWGRVLPPTRAFARSLRPALAPLVDELQTHAAPSSRVATPDIGYIGYHANVRVVDLGGLIDPHMLALRRRVGDFALLQEGFFLERAAVDFVIDRALEPERFDGHVTRGLRWKPLRTTSIANLGLSRPGPYYYTLYALERTDAASSDP